MGKTHAVGLAQKLPLEEITSNQVHNMFEQIWDYVFRFWVKVDVIEFKKLRSEVLTQI